jgi:hypothetical protein
MEFGGIYKCVVTKQKTFFYLLNFAKEEIEIITLFDTRQDPDKQKKQLDQVRKHNNGYNKLGRKCDI